MGLVSQKVVQLQRMAFDQRSVAMQIGKWTLLLGFALLALKAGAQTTPTTLPANGSDTPIAPTKVVPKYALGPGDVISIRVVNFPDLSMDSVQIPPDGKITPPLLAGEPINVLGKTVEQVAAMLTEAWSKYVINPSVSVFLVQKRPQDAVIVYGYTPKTGAVEMRPGLRILDVISAMGGGGETGDLSHVTVTHEDGTSQTLDLSNPETKGDSPENILLHEGDIVYVPKLYQFITVLGEVKQGGQFPYEKKMTVADAIALAGGYIEGEADLSAATITRNGKTIPIDLQRFYLDGDTSQNLTLQPGDSILIPRQTNIVYIYGAVAGQGPYDFRPGDRLWDAINRRGGPTQEANIGAVEVIHTELQSKLQAELTQKYPKQAKDSKWMFDQLKKQGAIQVVDLNRYFRGDQSVNVPLSAGDFIYVPSRKHGFGIGDLFQILSSANLLRLLAGF
ncbi:periplasmic protein involved in polysaccharide export [Chthonomonas calidirosea]|nr:periplasmic protein involved in polysaccharide export [Chthonomonas calidirosea]